MPIFDNNRELLERFRRGDRAALAEVYYFYVDDVATLARRGFTMESSGHVYVRGADRDGEHELVQDTFTRAFAEKARLAYDGLHPYRPYLLRITKNRMIDRYRSDKRGEGAGDIDEILATNASLAGADEPPDLHWQTLLAAAREHVATLDDESRQLIKLRFEDELSQDDTAAKMRCTRRRVRTVEDKVLASLRKWLQRQKLHE